jgi:hypothetical protein
MTFCAKELGGNMFAAQGQKSHRHHPGASGEIKSYQTLYEGNKKPSCGRHRMVEQRIGDATCWVLASSLPG